MKKHVKTRKLGRDRQARRALLRGLVSSLIEHESLTTTSAKARFVQPVVEKLLTRAKRGGLADHRSIHTMLQNKSLVKKLVSEIAPRFQKTQGGYTTLTQVGSRRGDSARLVRLSLTNSTSPSPVKSAKVNKSKKPTAKTPANKTTPAAHPDSAKPTHSAPKQVSRSGKRGDR